MQAIDFDAKLRYVRSYLRPASILSPAMDFCYTDVVQLSDGKPNVQIPLHLSPRGSNQSIAPNSLIFVLSSFP
jgi:hypothetical protein